MRVALAGLSLLLAASAPAAAQFDPGGLATRLKTGMTIGQALLALGNRPTSTLETTCRQVTGEPFTCRIWNYTTLIRGAADLLPLQRTAARMAGLFLEIVIAGQSPAVPGSPPLQLAPVPRKTRGS